MERKNPRMKKKNSLLKSDIVRWYEMDKFKKLQMYCIAISQFGDMRIHSTDMYLICASTLKELCFDEKLKLNKNRTVQELDKHHPLGGYFWLLNGGRQIYQLGENMLDVYDALCLLGLIGKFTNLFGNQKLTDKEREYIKKFTAI